MKEFFKLYFYCHPGKSESVKQTAYPGPTVRLCNGVLFASKMYKNRHAEFISASFKKILKQVQDDSFRVISAIKYNKNSFIFRDDDAGNRLSSYQWIKWLIMFLWFPLSVMAAPLEIMTQNGSKKFEAELALTPQQQEKGLMFRTHLALDHGMLFLRDPNIPTAMWMKNTPLSLDMIFVDEDGKIIHIEKAATPFSKKIIGPIHHTRAVFEVVGGTCEKEQIQAGDTLKHEMF